MRKAARTAVSSIPRGVPLGAKVGVIIMLLGLGLDAFVHLFMAHSENVAVAGFSLPEHFSHLVVIVGMLVMLGAIVANGARGSAHPVDRSTTSGGNDAIR